MNSTPVGRGEERKRRGEESKGEGGRRVSRWLGTCRTHRESLARVFTPLIAPFRLLSLPLACLLQLPFFFTLPSTHTQTHKGQARMQPSLFPELLFTCSHHAQAHTQTWICSRRQYVTRNVPYKLLSFLLFSFMTLSTCSSFSLHPIPSTLHLVC